MIEQHQQQPLGFIPEVLVAHYVYQGVKQKTFLLYKCVNEKNFSKSMSLKGPAYKKDVYLLFSLMKKTAIHSHLGWAFYFYFKAVFICCISAFLLLSQNNP